MSDNEKSEYYMSLNCKESCKIVVGIWRLNSICINHNWFILKCGGMIVFIRFLVSILLSKLTSLGRANDLNLLSMETHRQ